MDENSWIVFHKIFWILISCVVNTFCHPTHPLLVSFVCAFCICLLDNNPFCHRVLLVGGGNTVPDGLGVEEVRQSHRGWISPTRGPSWCWTEVSQSPAWGDTRRWRSLYFWCWTEVSQSPSRGDTRRWRSLNSWVQPENVGASYPSDTPQLGLVSYDDLFWMFN